MEQNLAGAVLIAAGLFGLVATTFAAFQIWYYFDGSPRWTRSTANIVTGLSIIPLLWGGCLVFVVLWASWWLTKRIWRLTSGLRKGRDTVAGDSQWPGA
jgi:hypothetical protein